MGSKYGRGAEWGLDSGPGLVGVARGIACVVEVARRGPALSPRRVGLGAGVDVGAGNTPQGGFCGLENWINDALGAG
jgi:hypothetical protein